MFFFGAYLEYCSLLEEWQYDEASQDESSSREESNQKKKQLKKNTELPSESEIRQQVESGRDPYLDFIREASIRSVPC